MEHQFFFTRQVLDGLPYESAKFYRLSCSIVLIKRSKIVFKRFHLVYNMVQLQKRKNLPEKEHSINNTQRSYRLVLEILFLFSIGDKRQHNVETTRAHFSYTPQDYSSTGWLLGINGTLERGSWESERERKKEWECQRLRGRERYCIYRLPLQLTW